MASANLFEVTYAGYEMATEWREPPAWKVARFGNVARIRRRAAGDGMDLLSVYLGRGVIPYAEGGKRVHAPSLDMSAYQEVRPGDLVLNNQQAWRGSVGVSRYSGLVSPAYLVCELNSELDPRYAEHLFTSPYMVSQFVTASKGVGDIQRTLHLPFLKNCRVLVPPRDEQAAIVKYLGHAHARIDRTITARRDLIALLEEQKQAIIQEAVTRGLDPSVPRRDSGIPWLGEIPQHWERKRVGALFRETVVRSATGEENPLSMSQKLGLVPSDQVERSLGAESMIGGKLCEPGDLVLNRLKAHLGVFAIARQAGVVSPDYTVLRPNALAHSAYYEYVLKSMAVRSELRIRAKGIVEGFWRLYTNDLYTIVLPVPPIDEQRHIAAHLAEFSRGVANAIDRILQEVELLQEFRTRLTSDVVTGQVDILAIAASLPELTEPPAGSTHERFSKNDESIEPEFEFAGARSDLIEPSGLRKRYTEE